MGRWLPREVARDIGDARQRGAALRAVALSLAQVGHGALAWEVARDIEDARQRGAGTGLGGVVAAQAGGREQARRSEAWETARTMENASWRGAALRAGALSWRKLAGEEASKAFTEAWETARDIENTSWLGARHWQQWRCPWRKLAGGKQARRSLKPGKLPGSWRMPTGGVRRCE